MRKNNPRLFEIRKFFHHNILTLLALVCAISTYGQKSYGIKIYQNTDLFHTEYTESQTDKVTRVNKSNFSRVSVALTVSSKKQHFHELEFFIPEIDKSLDKIQYPMNYEFRIHSNVNPKGSSYSFRYEFDLKLAGNPDRFTFNVGAAINPYFVHLKYTPTNTTIFYFSHKYYGVNLNLVPKLKYKFTPRLSVDLSLPLKVYDFQGQEKHIANPNFPRPQQTFRENESIFFEKVYNVRLGIEYTLNTPRK